MENKILILDLLDLHKKLSTLQDILDMNHDVKRSKSITPVMEILEDLHRELPKKPLKPETVSPEDHALKIAMKNIQDIGDFLKMALPTESEYGLVVFKYGKLPSDFSIASIDLSSMVEKMQGFIKRSM